MLRNTHNNNNSAIVAQSKQIIEAIARSSNVNERISCLELAIIALNHDSAAAHDAVVGGVAVVVQSWRRDYYSYPGEERYPVLLRLYIELLTIMMFRCSKNKASLAFYRIGADLVSLILLAVDSYSDNELQTATLAASSFIDQLASWDDICLYKLDKNESLIRGIQRIIRNANMDQPRQTAALQLLSSWAKYPENRDYLLRLPGLVEDILAAAATANNEKSSHYISTVLSHLTKETIYKTELVKKKGFLEVVLLFLKKVYVPTCLEALNTVLHVTTEASCRLLVCQHENGALISTILEKMGNLQLIVVHQVICRLITREIVPWILKKHLAIVEQLKAKSFAGKDCDSGDDLSRASVLATQSLKRLAKYIPVQSKVHPTLLDALTVLANAKNAEIRLWAVRGLSEQAKSSTARFYIARCPCLLETIVDRARKDPNKAVKSKAMEALLFLASDNSNAKRLANNSELLEALVENVKQAELCKTSARAAVQAILFLATHRLANIRSVAKTVGLVESLSRYGVSRDTDDELKRAALKCVVMLAPFI